MTTIDLVLVIRVLRVELAKTTNYAKQAQIKVLNGDSLWSTGAWDTAGKHLDFAAP
jgi:hypothetical protein